LRGIPRDLRSSTSDLRSCTSSLSSATLFGRFYYVGRCNLLHFVYNYVHHPALLPEAFINSRYFIFNDKIHNYNTRTKTNLHLYYSSSSAGLRTTRHKAAVLWNELPLSLSLQQLDSFRVFPSF